MSPPRARVVRNRIVALLVAAMLTTACVESSRSESGDDDTENDHTETTEAATGTKAAPVERASGGGLLVPPEGSYYHGVFPGGEDGWEADITPAQVDAYEEAVGRKVAWVYFSDNWFDDHDFPADTAEWIRDRGALPFVRLMLRSKIDEVEGPDPEYPLQRILDGDLDGDLQQWGADAAAFGTPLLVEFGTEVNGDWFPWNGRWNGGEEDGPGRFRDAYRHVVEQVEAGGADNLTWVFHVNETSSPDDEWNRFEEYFPGDDVVDWLAVSVYGILSPTEKWITDFVEAMDDVVGRFAELAPNLPVTVAELGASGGNPEADAPEWAADALDALLADRWPSVRGFSWWNERWQNDDDPDHDTDMRVQSVDGLSEVFQDRLPDNPDVVDTPLTE